jgi:hypothetical protein
MCARHIGTALYQNVVAILASASHVNYPLFPPRVVQRIFRLGSNFGVIVG